MEDSRALVTARTIDGLIPIDGADVIELAQVEGWQVVVKKGEFAVGDPCVYFEIDSFLPDGNPAWQFLVDKSSRNFNGVKGHRLRTIKLRGSISQGFVTPTSAFPIIEAVKSQDTAFAVRDGLDEQFQALVEAVKTGTPLRELKFDAVFGVVKWEQEMSPQLAGQARGFFPSYIRKTDQERCQNLGNKIFGYEPTIIPANEFHPEIIRPAPASPDDTYEVSLKLDGSSMTGFVVGEKNEAGELNARIGVCSRNLELKINEENAENAFVKTLTSTKLDKALIKFYENTGLEIAVQGELMGPGIQSNREQHTGNVFYLFDVFFIQVGGYAAPGERKSIFNKLVEYGADIKHAPILAEKTTLQELGIHSVKDLLQYAEGPSIKHPVREGVVFKRTDGQFSFKAISNKYLEKEKD